MGSEYVWGRNPFRDFFLNSLLLDVDISSKKEKKDVDRALKVMLENFLINPEEIVHLDFEITNKNGHYRIKGKNMLTALWLIGLIPADGTEFIDGRKNSFTLGEKKYTYNNKTKELTYIIINK